MTNLKLTIEGDATTLATVLSLLGAVDINIDQATDMVEQAPTAVPTIVSEQPPETVAPVMTPAPVAVSEAPAPTAVPEAPATGTVELDKDGLPWDERIHSASKKTKNDGTWVRRKGADKDAIPAIEAELRASIAGAAPATPEAPVVPETPFPIPNGPTTNAPTPMPEMAAPALTPEPPVQQPPVAPEPPVQQPPVAPPVTATPEPVAPVQQPPATVPTPAPAAATGEMNGAQFMQHLTGKMAEKDAEGQPLVDVAYLDGLVQEIAGQFNTELKVITDIFTNQDMINYAIGALQRDGRW